MSVEIIDGQRVCTDCILFIANGELPDEPHDDGTPRHWGDDEPHGPRAQQILAGVEHDLPGSWALGNGEVDEFAVSPCDCCGTTLGGERHDAEFVTQVLDPDPYPVPGAHTPLDEFVF